MIVVGDADQPQQSGIVGKINVAADRRQEVIAHGQAGNGMLARAAAESLELRGDGVEVGDEATVVVNDTAAFSGGLAARVLFEHPRQKRYRAQRADQGEDRKQRHPDGDDGERARAIRRGADINQGEQREERGEHREAHGACADAAGYEARIRLLACL